MKTCGCICGVSCRGVAASGASGAMPWPASPKPRDLAGGSAARGTLAVAGLHAGPEAQSQSKRSQAGKIYPLRRPLYIQA